MKKNIKLYLLSGFLGSGKTTFLTNLLNDLSNEKIGVIMNEFGKIGIDGPIIKKQGMELVEINRGSIFCSCLKLSFVSAMAEMADKDLNYLFVESSGLADPSNIGDVLYGVKQTEGDVYDYKGAICIVDALNFLQQVQELETVERQIKFCHLVVINKTDLVSEEILNEIKEKIRQINDKVEIKEASFGKFEYDFLYKDIIKNQEIEGEDTTNTPNSKPKTLTLTYNGQVNKEELNKFLEIVSKDTYRMKGFLYLDNGWNQVDVVNSKIDYKKCEDKKEDSKLVIISKIGPKVIKPIIDTWNEIVKNDMKLRN
ncbi:CobW family GTP-binding protein [Haloimpatiens sp. FM7330]|uniref:CobW family GTP-binding protein n=1 Tax=Haloimpatiens sp. FM7330 TaxID=3298610 RepID=UPI003624F0D6